MLMKSAFVKYFANSRSVAAFLANEESLAKKAATDLEFAKYFTNADFMSIVK